MLRCSQDLSTATAMQSKIMYMMTHMHPTYIIDIAADNKKRYQEWDLVVAAAVAAAA